jgi:hypothetical protein
MVHDSTNCHFHQPFHWGWGGFAEELFYHTSRYYFATEVFLRNFAEDETFSMAGYKAEYLSTQQRDLLAAVLSYEPGQHTAATVISIVSAVERKVPGIEQELADSYLNQQERPIGGEKLRKRRYWQGNETSDVPPLDPFLNIAERLQLPVAIRGHHVEVSLHLLAGHLDSSNSTLRTNLQNAVLQLHNAGYILRNHPHLTHLEAHAMAERP